MSFIPWLLLGATLGLFQILSQQWTVNRLNPEAPSMGLFGVLAGASLRLTLTFVLLVSAFKAGLIPGILAFTGAFLIRWLVLIRNEGK